MFDMNTKSLDDVRLAWRDPGPIPPIGVVLEPPRQDFYDSWDQWVNTMERPKAYADQLFGQGLSYVYGVCILLLCDSIPEPLEFYLGPVKPPQLITSTFKSGGLHYSATWPISTVALVTTQKRKRDNTNSSKDGEAQQEK